LKKITLLILFISSFSFGQQIFFEDFNAALALPTGWTITDIPMNGEVWTFETGGEAGPGTAGNNFVYDPGGASGNYAAFDSDAYGNNGTAEESSLVSPVINCTGFTQVTLEFNHLFFDGFGGQGVVEVYNGTSWVAVETYSAATVFGLVTLDVTAQLAGVSDAQVRFTWTGDWSFAWYIDNVELFQCTDSAPTVVITPGPADGATNVALDQTDAANFPNRVFFSWVDGPGDPGTSYTLNLDTATPPTANSFSFTNGDFIFNLAYDTTYYWTVESTNCAGNSTSAIWSFTTEQDPALSIDEFDLNAISVTPNPTKDILNIRTNLDLDSVQVYNLLGQSVAQFNGNSLTNKSINLSNLEDGLYMIEVIAGNKRQTFKVTKN